MGLHWHNSACEMSVNLNIKPFGEILRVLYAVFVQVYDIWEFDVLIGIYNSPCIFSSKVCAWWRTLLFPNS